jgi:hypothetical protein
VLDNKDMGFGGGSEWRTKGRKEFQVGNSTLK